jgi:hypothetical protein
MPRHTINNVLIHTSYEFPSIGYRALDWLAVTDSYDGAPDSDYHPIGHGCTEQEAIKDLLEQLE